MPTKCCSCDVNLALHDWSGRSDSPNLEMAVKLDGADYCSACASKHGSITASDTAEKAQNEHRKAIESIIATTTPSIDGYRVTKVIDVISAECVFGMNLFKDIFMALSDFFGGRNETSQKTLRDARQLCIYELKSEAYRLGANAVIGVSLNYSELSGKNTSMLFLVASGTAVVLDKNLPSIEKTIN